ncbi:MAG TPA: hypothetical protein VMV79_03415 [Alphaproteobacteria bacterium]|nr:hypothetical protein [Alphaproteobacteria bacterium]
MAVKPKRKTVFKPEKADWRRVVLMLLVLIAGVWLVVTMVRSRPMPGKLVCDSGPVSGDSLIAFGRCHHE